MSKIQYKLSYKEQIYNEIKKAHREQNAEKVVYYQNALGFVACAGYEKFKASWAYDGWLKDNVSKIEEVERTFKRFSYLN